MKQKTAQDVCRLGELMHNTPMGDSMVTDLWKCVPTIVTVGLRATLNNLGMSVCHQLDIMAKNLKILSREAEVLGASHPF